MLWTHVSLTAVLYLRVKVTFIILNGHVLRSNVNKHHTGQSRSQRAELKLSSKLAHDFALQLVETTELSAFEAHAVEADEPADQSSLRRLGVVG